MQSAEMLRAPRYPDLPAPMRKLPLDKRGFPVPWFVAWHDGVPIFPAMDERKRRLAWRDRLCWVCGGKIGRIQAFVIGPMCAVNRVSSEPPSHRECARFSARHCPFLANPRMGRAATYKGHEIGDDAPGIMIPRNPGVALVWQTLKAGVIGDGKGSFLFDIGRPHKVEWYAWGRPATRGEVMTSIESGLPLLLEQVEADPQPVEARAEYDRLLAAALELVPA